MCALRSSTDGEDGAASLPPPRADTLHAENAADHVEDVDTHGAMPPPKSHTTAPYPLAQSVSGDRRVAAVSNASGDTYNTDAHGKGKVEEAAEEAKDTNFKEDFTNSSRQQEVCPTAHPRPWTTESRWADMHRMFTSLRQDGQFESDDTRLSQIRDPRPCTPWTTEARFADMDRMFMSVSSEEGGVGVAQPAIYDSRNGGRKNSRRGLKDQIETTTPLAGAQMRARR